MKPLVILVLSFLVFLALGITLLHPEDHWIFAGNFSMAFMLIFTSIGHFKFPDGMARMIPQAIPFRKPFVYASGLWEIMLAIGLMFPGSRIGSGWIAVIFFCCILPVNIYAALHHVNMEKPELRGPGPGYLWFRVPLQIFFIAWIWLFSIDQLDLIYSNHWLG